MFNSIETIDKTWRRILQSEFNQPYMSKLQDFLTHEERAGKIIYPSKENIFNAFSMTPFDQVKVVIIGQDPYHGEGQAHGLSFSVPNGIKPPPSLKNIYKEIELEFGMPMPRSGDLTGWAKQGVLLLNATLTVQQAHAGSHQKKGWEEFTDAAIKLINEHHTHIVYMLWGSYAQKKGAVIDRSKNLVSEAVHPSPLSAHRGFLGCNHFKLANQYLKKHGKKEIDWYAAG